MVLGYRIIVKRRLFFVFFLFVSDETAVEFRSVRTFFLSFLFDEQAIDSFQIIR